MALWCNDSATAPSRESMSLGTPPSSTARRIAETGGSRAPRAAGSENGCPTRQSHRPHRRTSMLTESAWMRRVACVALTMHLAATKAAHTAQGGGKVVKNLEVARLFDLMADILEIKGEEPVPHPRLPPGRAEPRVADPRISRPWRGRIGSTRSRGLARA
jgi:hypothetical protein